LLYFSSDDSKGRHRHAPKEEPYLKWVNWIYAIVTFVIWKNAITKTQVGNMPLQLFHTSIYAIFLSKRITVQNIICISMCISILTVLSLCANLGSAFRFDGCQNKLQSSTLDENMNCPNKYERIVENQAHQYWSHFKTNSRHIYNL
jgi:hypothetical protein